MLQDNGSDGFGSDGDDSHGFRRTFPLPATLHFWERGVGGCGSSGFSPTGMLLLSYAFACRIRVMELCVMPSVYCVKCKMPRREKGIVSPGMIPPCKCCGGDVVPGNPLVQRKRAKRKKNRKFCYAKYINSIRWAKKRIQALEHYGYKCDICKTDQKLQVHHKSYRNVGKEQMADLRVLCKDCHSIEHENKYRSSDPLSVEFRQIIG